MVKIEFGKGDFVWISLIVVLLGVGFVYAYGGNNPEEMGHSVGEIEDIPWSKIVGAPDGLDGFSAVSNTYGSIVLAGSKGDYSGIDFSAVTGNGGELMVHNTADIQGFYKEGGKGWSWYFQNGKLIKGSVANADYATTAGNGCKITSSSSKCTYPKTGTISSTIIDCGSGGRTSFNTGFCASPDYGGAGDY